MFFDAVRFLKTHFHSATRLRQLVRLYMPELDLQDATVRKWFTRGSIPGDWLVVLLVVLEMDEGKPVSATPFLVRP